MRINQVPNIYIPKQTQPFKIENLKKAPVKKIEKIIRESIVEDNLGHANYQNRSLSETVEAHLKIVRNLEYVEVKWEVSHHEYDGEVYEYEYSKELDIGFYREKFNRLLNTANSGNFIDTSI